MSLFTSDRERRLWFWALAVLVVIWATLGTAGMLAAELRERNLLRVASTAGLLLAAGVFVVRWARGRPGRGEIGAAIGVAFAYWWSWIRIQTPEERTHLLEYGILAALVHGALVERARHGRGRGAPAVVAWIAVALLGWIDEGIQALLPGRVYDLRDVGFNAFAATLAVGAGVVLSWARRRRRRGEARER